MVYVRHVCQTSCNRVGLALCETEHSSLHLSLFFFVSLSTEDIEMEGEDDANADTSSIKQRELSDVYLIYYPVKKAMVLLRFFVGLSVS